MPVFDFKNKWWDPVDFSLSPYTTGVQSDQKTSDEPGVVVSGYFVIYLGISVFLLWLTFACYNWYTWDDEVESERARAKRERIKKPTEAGQTRWPKSHKIVRAVQRFFSQLINNMTRNDKGHGKGKESGDVLPR